jgi:hypothetical protein
MKKSNRISLRLQIRSVKNAFFQVGNLPFKKRKMVSYMVRPVLQEKFVRNIKGPT